MHVSNDVTLSDKDSHNQILVAAQSSTYLNNCLLFALWTHVHSNPSCETVPNDIVWAHIGSQNVLNVTLSL